MKFTPFVILIWLVSCQSKKDIVSPNTAMATAVYEAQVKYLDNTILNYSRLSDIGQHYWQQNKKLETWSMDWKEKIVRGETFTADETLARLEPFSQDIKTHPLFDEALFEKIATTPVVSISDVDQLRLYVKNCMVAVLTNNKALPFDTWGITGSAQKGTIKDGEFFEMQLAITASSSNYPNEWYLVKEDRENVLSADNIADTLHPDQFGTVAFRTRNYHKGENELYFVSKLNTPAGNSFIEKRVIFYVK